MKKVVVIMGPTAVGKTDISIEIAKKYNGEIINADASQFKKDLNIGTAKVDYNNTDVPHHLFDLIEAEEHYSIKDFQEAARKKIDELIKNNKLPILVGGSGLYIKAVIENYKFSDSERDFSFESNYNNYSNEELHQLLLELDPKSAEKIHANNRRRTLRAIEVALKTDILVSENIVHNDYVYDALQICLNVDREILYDRINQRVDLMVENGWLEEIKSLINKGVNFERITDIGYNELAHYLIHNDDLNDTKEIIKQKTRRYAKRQLTWFKNKMNCIFVNMDYNNPNKTLNEINELLIKFLK